MARGGSSCLPVSIIRVTLLFTAFAGGLFRRRLRNRQARCLGRPQTRPKQLLRFRRSAKCQHPADPLRRHAECIDEDFDWDETLAGAWNGIRKRMREIGITPTMSYTGALQTNPSGGPHQVWSYAGQLVLGEMYLQQTFSEKKLKLAGGRLAPSNSFAVLPVFANYVNYGINPNPYSLGANDISFFGPPTGTEWGVQGTYNVNSEIQVAAGAFNTNKNSANGEGHGTDFVLQEGNKGALVIGEIDYLRNQKLTDTGKPGQYAIGVLHNNNSFPTLPDGEGQSNSYSGVYVMGQQMIYRPFAPGTAQGLTAWGTFTFNSKPLVNPMPAFLGTGLSYEGLIAAQSKDVVSAGWIYGKVSKVIPDTSAEQLVEVNYQWRHSGYLIITPQFQYIWKPSGRNLPDAAVAGVQLALTF